jgi:hypothetical protein
MIEIRSKVDSSDMRLAQIDLLGIFLFSSFDVEHNLTQVADANRWEAEASASALTLSQ